MTASDGITPLHWGMDSPSDDERPLAAPQAVATPTRGLARKVKKAQTANLESMTLRLFQGDPDEEKGEGDSSNSTASPSRWRRRAKSIAVADKVEVELASRKSRIEMEDGHMESGGAPSNAELLARCVQEAIKRLGSSSTTAYITANMLRVKQYMPETFAQIRQLSNVCHNDYFHGICEAPLQQVADWSPDANPQFAVWTAAEGEYVIESVPAHKVKSLVRIAEQYLEYLESKPGTLLSRIFGVYDLTVPPKLGGHICLMVLKATLPRQARLNYLYNLKGTVQDRFVQRTGIGAQMLEDANFVEEQQVMMVERSQQESIMRIIDTDTSFLEECGLADYSLVLGMRKADTHLAAPTLAVEPGYTGWRPSGEQVLYYLGLRVFGLSRPIKGQIAQTVIDSAMSVVPGSLSRYRKRFLTFMEDRLLPIDVGKEYEFKPRSMHGSFQIGSFRQRVDRTIPDALAMCAVVELEYHGFDASMEQMAQWQALVDMVEAGKQSSRTWDHMHVDTSAQTVRDFCSRCKETTLPPNQQPKESPGGIAGLQISKFMKMLKMKKAEKDLGGKIIGRSSTQYSLALAIAVGVEATTKVSSRLRLQSADLFTKYPWLRQRHAAASSVRRVLLPEEGCWMSPSHMLPDLSFDEYAPELFAEIRSTAGMSDIVYIRSVCQRDFSFIEFSTNSKSGEFFFFTHDGRCMVKTISMKEADALLELLRNGYSAHMKAPEGSLLTRIYGLYSIQLPWLRKGKPQVFIVQENVLLAGNQKMSGMYDLKGSTKGRTAKPGQSVQKDNDWIGQGARMNFPNQLRDKMSVQLRRDCEFLASCNVLDYSILVGVMDEPGTAAPPSPAQRRSTLAGGAFSTRRSSMARRSSVAERMDDARQSVAMRTTTVLLAKRSAKVLWARLRDAVLQGPRGFHGPFDSAHGKAYCMGIIDFLIPWNCYKRGEYVLRTLQGTGNTASVNPPWRYAQRQIEFFERTIL